MFALKVKLTPEEQERFRHAPTNNLQAYDYWLRGLESIFRAFYEGKKEANAQARQMFEKAVELDPQYAGAYAGLGMTYWTGMGPVRRAGSNPRAGFCASAEGGGLG